jgi:hypothetical protein
MMRCNSFLRSVLFGAVAAAGWPLWLLLAFPVLGRSMAQPFYLIAVTVLYIAALAPSRPRGFVAAAIAALAAAAMALAVGSFPELVIALAVVLGVARSGFLLPTAPARGVLREAVLLIGGLCFARLLVSTTVPSVSLALWGFFLVQSVLFLFADTPRRAAAPEVDPFDAACRRAVALLDRSVV